MYNYRAACRLLTGILDDFRILSGDVVGPSGSSWQDVAMSTSDKLRAMASMLDEARKGEVQDGPVQFPSPDDLESEKGYDPVGGGGGRGRSDLPHGQGGGDD